MAYTKLFQFGKVLKANTSLMYLIQGYSPIKYHQMCSYNSDTIHSRLHYA